MKSLSLQREAYTVGFPLAPRDHYNGSFGEPYCTRQEHATPAPPRLLAMSLISRLERWFGRFAIPNLTIVIIAGQAALFLASFLPQGISLERVALDPGKVMQGEVWRLLTFLFTPPARGMGPIFALIYFSVLHLLGSTLEHHWGEFRFNLYLFIGWIANVAAAFAAWVIIKEQLGFDAELMELAGITASNGFLYGSLFLAFARLYPDFIFNLFFVLPIRVKWLALLAWLTYGYLMVRGNWMVRMLILATVLNYLLFFGREHWQEFRHGHRRRSFQAKAKRALKPARHTCEVCGLNSDESPRTLFRYCSKCTGQKCYCPEHIRNHEHVVQKEPAV